MVVDDVIVHDVIVDDVIRSVVCFSVGRLHLLLHRLEGSESDGACAYQVSPHLQPQQTRGALEIHILPPSACGVSASG